MPEASPKRPQLTFLRVVLQALMDMFYQDEGEPHHGVPDTSASVLAPSPSSAAASSLSYEEVVKELMTSERQYLRELHMVIRVFREEIVKLSADQRELDAIFSNIMDIYELTVTLLGSLEDVIEMAQDQMPYIGSCFEGTNYPLFMIYRNTTQTDPKIPTQFLQSIEVML